MSLLITLVLKKDYCHSVKSRKIIILHKSVIISKEVNALEETSVNMHI